MDYPDDFEFGKYSMSSNPRGNVLIINNEHLKEKFFIDGASVDFANLQNVFNKLGFKIHSYSNLEFSPMRDAIRNFARLEDHANVDMVAVCILSHGNDYEIQSTDGVGFKREKIIEMFNNQNSHLDGKPKMFLFHSCYGNMVDYGVPDKKEPLNMEQTEADAVPFRPRERTEAPFARFREQTEANSRSSCEDMVIIHASVTGYSTCRDPKTGSWLVESICEVFQKYSHKYDLRYMLDIVAAAMSKNEGIHGQKQGIEVSTRHFYKKLMFNPETAVKIYEDINSSVPVLTVPVLDVPVLTVPVLTVPVLIGTPVPTPRDAVNYWMGHKKRGKAYIFNHENFDSRLQMSTRTGTNVDRDRLMETLKSLGFEVMVHDDLTVNEINDILEKASDEDHSEADCVFVCVMTHGDMDTLYARDRPYMVKDLWRNFTADICKTLAGKPKIFLIQACRGGKEDIGLQVRPMGAQRDNNDQDGYRIPVMADFFVGYTTISGFVSWRNAKSGTWFIQAFCDVVQEKGFSEEFVSLMTEVSRKVAYNSEDYKQIPCQTSMLTRKVIFNRK